jgi:hypothetical protein
MHLLKLTPPSGRPLSLLFLSMVLLVSAVFVPLILEAGSGGVQGGCAYVTTVNGKTKYLACTGENLPMWYSASNPSYNQGDSACGQYGNQNCGADLGDPLNE